VTPMQDHESQPPLPGGTPVERPVGRLVPERATACMPLEWPRADPAALARFDPRTKLCTMNCGPHREDPRTNAERKLLCGDCVENWNR